MPKPRPKSRPVPLGDTDHVSQSDLGRTLHISKTAIQQWLIRKDDPCPRNADGTYSIADIYNWRMGIEKGKAEKGDSLRDQKTKVEIERITAQIEKINENYVLRTEHEARVKATIAPFPKFWEQTIRRNYQEFVGLDADQAYLKLKVLCDEVLKNYAGIV